MIFVRLRYMPISVRSFAFPDFDNPMDTVIVLNANLSMEKRHIALEHELLHICRDDLYSSYECDLIESSTHVEESYYGKSN